MPALLDALRQDAAAGALGYITQSDLYSSSFHFRRNTGVATVTLMYDYASAGIPAAFEPYVLHDDEGKIIARGLDQMLMINERCVSTLRVLRELGLSL